VSERGSFSYTRPILPDDVAFVGFMALLLVMTGLLPSLLPCLGKNACPIIGAIVLYGAIMCGHLQWRVTLDEQAGAFTRTLLFQQRPLGDPRLWFGTADVAGICLFDHGDGRRRRFGVDAVTHGGTVYPLLFSHRWFRSSFRLEIEPRDLAARAAAFAGVEVVTRDA